MCVLPVPVRGQEAQPDTVIRSESRLVLVDALAVDKKGRFAADLTQKDFKVWEDGKEQKITSFSLESSGVSADRPGKHYFVLFFDTSSGGAEPAIRNEATRFVDGFASPDRYMAVLDYAYNGGLRIGQNFTTDSDRLKKALGSIRGPSGAATLASTGGAAIRGGAGPALAATATSTYAPRELLNSLRALAASLAGIRGRKALVLFGAASQANSDIAMDLRTAIQALNKANVAVYAAGSGNGAGADPGAAAPLAGVRGRQGPTAIPSTDLSTSLLSLGNALAEGTGGLTFVGTSELAASLGKVAQEQDQYYLLGYTPLVEAAEGTCHELKVKVSRGDLEVRARQGYCTAKPADVLSGKPIGKDLEAKAASGAQPTITAKMQLPWFYTAPNVARVNLAMDINTSGVKFRHDKTGFHGEFDLAGTGSVSGGAVAARVSDTVKLDFLTQQQVDEFLVAPYHYENQFEIAPGSYSFRMAFSSGEQAFGKVELPLKIEPWSGQALSASGIALSRDAHPAASLASGLDVSLLEGIRPLISKGVEVVPAGNTGFRVGEKAFFYFEIYEPLLAAIPAKPGAQLPPVSLRLRLLESATGKQLQDSGAKLVSSYMMPGNAVIPVQSVLPIEGLPAGKYAVEVRVMREAGDPVVRTAEFEIN